jgi:hypothetical protein
MKKVVNLLSIAAILALILALNPVATLAQEDVTCESDVIVQADVALGGSGTHAGLIARYSGPAEGRFYVGMVYNNNGVYQAYIFLRQDGAFTQLAVKNLTGFTGSGNVRFEVVGKQLKLFVNNVLQAVAYNSAITSAGLVGMRGLSASLDNFNAAGVVSQTTNPPFNDSFTKPNNSDLDRVWTERVGAFSIQNNRAAASVPGVSIATLNSSALVNPDLQANVTLTGSGSHAGLVARYSGPDENNFYVGLIYNNNGVYQAYIFLNQSGGFVQLAGNNLTGFPGTGTLRFQLFGTTLNLFVNGNLVATASNSVLSSGQVGIRSLGASLDDFSV